MSARWGAPLLVAAAVRLLAIAVSDREVADVLRYRKVADHVLDVSWNPYQAPRLHPYPPVWVWVEAGAGWLARHAPVSFPLLMKLPTLAADLWIVALLARRTRAGAWIYALHPVAIMVGAFHGQFDAAALALVVAALLALERSGGGAFPKPRAPDPLRRERLTEAKRAAEATEKRDRPDRAALLLAAAIALKSFPVLLLPVFLLQRPRWKDRVRFAALALGPVAALLLPYALHDPGALRRELLGYGGVADFGWIGLWRGLRWLATGALARSEASHWEGAITAGKLLFLAAYGALLAWLVRRRIEPGRAALLTFLLFLTFYGALSAQYLLWVVPLAALRRGRWMIAHGAASTLSLIGFYLFLAPGVLTPASAATGAAAGVLWVVGTAAVLLAGLAWLRDMIASLPTSRG